jgi:hypothetical protein
MAVAKLTMFNYLVDGLLKPVYVNVTMVEGIRQDKNTNTLWVVFMNSGDHFATDNTNAMAIRDAVNAF